MLRNRLLILLGGCFLSASAAWADGVGFIDCRDHPDQTPVFGKARRPTIQWLPYPAESASPSYLTGLSFSHSNERRSDRLHLFESDLGGSFRFRAGADLHASAGTRCPRTHSKRSRRHRDGRAAQPRRSCTSSAHTGSASPTAAPASTSNLPSTAATVVQPTPAQPPQGRRPQPLRV